MPKNIKHISWGLYPGDLVVVTKDCQAIPDAWPAGITMHEGNTPRLNAGTIGLVVAKIGSNDDEYPYLKILVDEQIYGLFGKYLDLIITRR